MPDMAVQIAVEQAAFSFDKLYTYRWPADLGEPQVGVRVLVPFGNGNRRRQGLVMAVGADADYPRLKPVSSVVDDTPLLTPEMLALARFMQERCFCTLFDAVRAMLPTGLYMRVKAVLKPAEDVSPDVLETLTPNERQILACVSKSAGGVEQSALLKRLGLDDDAPALKHLLELGVLRRGEDAFRHYGDASVRMVRLKVLPTDAPVPKLTAKQQAVLSLLEDVGAASVKEVAYFTGVTPAVITALSNKALVEVYDAEVLRSPYKEAAEAPPIVQKTLNAQQSAAYSTLCGLYEQEQPAAALLYGVTGSGKTAVYMNLIDRVLADGKQVIVLVPEISLTPQMMELFLQKYGRRVAMLHSGLAIGERMDEWKRIRRGDAQIVVGTRSAVFAPCARLGLIVMDEEQEHTYKSDMTPKYHARDIARYRCGVSGATMLLASATPSLESFYKAKSGAYTLIELRDRYGDATLPTVRFADLRRDAAAGSFASVGSEMAAAIAEAKQAGKQSILFINRRGYHNFLSCPICGEVKKCPHCSVAMTYHRYRAAGGAESGYLACHYCGMREPTPKTCPSCGNPKLRYMGYGTQKVEEELKERFPSLRVLRMDADTTQTKSASDRLLGAFRAGQADLLLGTQMVTKGHDFGNVTLVGVLNADTSLYLEDYRANERTFSLITQVVGRAGRGEHAGQALIQSYNPEHPTLQLAAAQDYGAFYDSEIKLRRTLVFPPFCDMIMVTVSDTDEVLTQRAALAFDEAWRRLAGEKGVKMVLFGPFEAPVYKVNDRYRMRIVVKCKDNKACRDVIRELLCSFAAKERKGQANPYKKVQFTVDINPTGL